MLVTMQKGPVTVDVAVDQGGCVETSRPTTHSNPTFYVDDVLHYCVANMPGAVPCTAIFALTNATLPWGVKLANKGFAEAIRSDPHLKNRMNTHAGRITYAPVARSKKPRAHAA
jgi:alanine dehydrogenase